MAPAQLSFRFPLAYRLFFLFVEPISALVGAFYTHFRQQRYLELLDRATAPAQVLRGTSVAMSQLANILLLRHQRGACAPVYPGSARVAGCFAGSLDCRLWTLVLDERIGPRDILQCHGLERWRYWQRALGLRGGDAEVVFPGRGWAVRTADETRKERL